MNKKVILVKRPKGPIKDTDFKVVSELLDTVLKQGEVLIRVEWLSIDPAQRVWISGKISYIPPVAVGKVVNGFGVGYVIISRSPAFKKGNFVFGLLGWQEFATVHSSGLNKLPSYENPQRYLGVLGITGLTAYFGVTEIARPQKKEVMIVSSAAGAVGSIACQIGKMKGCKVIGICGSDQKADWLMNVVKIDGCINYKTEKSLSHTIRKLCPEGVDIYIDNVGGEILDAVLANIRKNARIVLCGAISSYDNDKAPPIHNYPVAIAMSATLEGFIVWDDYQNRFELAVRQLSRWVQERKIIHREHVLEGLENAPKALSMVMAGDNFGKMIVRVVERLRL